jgi:hypothetical protein
LAKKYSLEFVLVTEELFKLLQLANVPIAIAGATAFKSRDFIRIDREVS